jgi:anti-repressor protein
VNEPTPFIFDSQHVRTTLIDGEPWFAAYDVCLILGYLDGRKSVRDHVPAQLQRVARFETPLSTSGYADLKVINEAGLYRLIMRSHATNAAKFQAWVTEEVLPSIRKTGQYTVAHQVPRTLADALQLAADQARELEAARPAVEFVDKFVSGGGTYLLREVAAVLNVKGMGQNNLFAFLRNQAVLITEGESRNLPYRVHIEAGRFEVKVGQRDNSRTGEPVAVRTARVTPRGLDYIRKLLEQNGYHCMAPRGEGQTTLTRATG